MENEKQLQVREKDLVTVPANDEVATYFKGASTLILTADESKVLSADFDDEMIEIRPDGFIYLPQTFYRQRLNQALGIGQWALLSKGSYQEGKKLFLNGILVIRGCFVSEATGEATLHEDNENQSLASVWESAKSDCITRCCKDLSIATQIYQPTYMRKWQQENAIQVWVEKKNKPQWRKKTSDPFFGEKGPVEKNERRDPFPYEHPDKNKPWLNQTTRSGGTTPEWTNAVRDITSGAKTIEDLEKEFAISKPTKELLLKQVPKKQQEQPQAETPKIAGAWYAMLEKCKHKDDVDELALKHKENIERIPGLRDLFVETRSKLPIRIKTA